MTKLLSPIGNDTLFFNGVIASGCKLFFYTAGTSSKLDTYTTITGATANSNPIVLDAYGRSANQIWLTDGSQYKVVIAPSTDTDPPSSGVTLVDYIEGINATQTNDSAQVDQWVLYSAAPTYVSSTQFTLTGDQTATFMANRRVKTVNTGGTVYSTITSASYGSGVTTVTIQNDSGVLDSGLSLLYYGLITPTNSAFPMMTLQNGTTATTQTTGDNTTKIATDAFVQQEIAAATAAISSGSVGIKGAFSNLSMSTTGTNSTVTAAADEVLTTNGSGAYHKCTSVSLSINTAAAGANGLDTGALAGSTWYFVFVIWNSGSNTTAGLISTSATAPTMPAGYAYFARIGAIKTDGTANKYPLSISQKGRAVSYKVAGGSNVTSYPQLAAGVAGDPTVPTYSAVSVVGSYVPSTASKIGVRLFAVNSYGMCSPNNATGNYYSTTNPPMLMTHNGSGYSHSSCDMLLESSSIYWAGAAATYLNCTGWEDNF